MEEVDWKQNLELMQHKLYLLVEETGSFIDPKVVELSQRIDRLIVTIQKKRLEDK
ncbi:aspartyl-phosphate phosphatase Spo0E family protein [Paenibacillus filicis]|uniref:Aspartyl-phosphate phosphatase Spo0E family protein n=1 Tax=Paenibacillus gyeongsangnamensis TaxID=3388067 RepID=A0ABT4QGF8_9BACL|nr:aspartyl-phosphate phosphatase Spo0E family protein [Paenibacillus filicis]MCZ8515963.1 aspartyl-phosphate phosphatase Spo0E family protein [Paenibacillus filicis]